MDIPPKVYQFLVCIFAAIGSFLYSYDLTIVASVTASESFNRKLQPTAVELGLFASLLTAGGFVGSAIVSPTSDALGRRLTIIIGAVIFIWGAALQTGAQNYNYDIAGRLTGGIGVGVLLMIVPLYQAEIAHPRIRGTVTALQQFMLGIGGIVGSWLSYGTFIGIDDNRQWQIPLGVQMVPAAIVGSLRPAICKLRRK